MPARSSYHGTIPAYYGMGITAVRRLLRSGERVHAVVVLKPGAEATAQELREHTKSLIAGYKAPKTVEFVDALP